MKFKILFIAVVFFAISQISCKKDKKQEILNELGSRDQLSLSDYIKYQQFKGRGILSITTGLLTTNDFVNGEDWHRGYTSVYVARYDSLVTEKTVSINGQNFDVQDNSMGRQSPTSTQWDHKDPKSDALFGKVVNIAAFGMSGNMRIPEQIKNLSPKPDNINLVATQVKRAEGLNLTWNADPQSRGVILELNAPGVYKVVKLLDDNGSYKVSTDILSELPKNTRFYITLRRVNYQLSEDKNFLILAQSSVLSSFEIAE